VTCAARIAVLLLAVLGSTGRAGAQPGDGYSAGSFYNAANAYARDGKPGLAILNYERALLLAPGDPDIEANLRLVRQSSHLPPEPAAWSDFIGRIAGPQTLPWIGLSGLGLVGASLFTGRRRPFQRARSGGGNDAPTGAQSGMRRSVRSSARGLLAALGLALLALTVCNGLVVWPHLYEAVIISPATPARVAPAPMGDPLFMLTEGQSVRMLVEHEDFVLVRTSAGKSGWVSRGNLAAVVPRR
jgi:hypothetical protein